MSISSNSNCCTSDADRFVVACSGASNVGQVSNSLAIKIAQEGIAKMTCLAALGANLPAYIESVIGSDLVVIDGCSVACAKKIVDQVGCNGYTYLTVTDFGVEKAKRFDRLAEEIDNAWAAVKTHL